MAVERERNEMNATTHTAPMLPETAPVSSIRAQRFDLYGPIHKAIRVVMSDMLVRMGKANFANADVAVHVVRDLEKLLGWCEQHIEHETKFIHPHLAARLPQALAKIDVGHEEHARFVAELRSLMGGVVNASSPELRALAGHTLYLHYSAYFADTLMHMVEEERVLQPLMHRFFTDVELLQINEAIVQSMPPEEAFESLGVIIPAVNGPERAGILGGVHAGVPPEAFKVFLGMIRPRLNDAEWTELLALCPFLG
jgi:iron-sulfur cluster repair protein YtfE (RIC family)